MLNHGANVPRIDARSHLASLAGATLLTPSDGRPNRILGISRDTVYVMAHGSPLGEQVPMANVQAAFDRLAAGEEVPVSVASLGDHDAFIAAAMLSLGGAELLSNPERVRLGR